jgi:peptide/nickel transport system substrate-binding protein
MKSKIGWLSISLVVALSLVLASCGPAAVEEGEGEVTAEEEEAVEGEVEMVRTALGTMREKPRYGGEIVYAQRRPVHGFDYITARGYLSYSIPMVYEELIMADWLKGPIGQNLTDYRMGEWDWATRENLLCTDWKYEVVDGEGVATFNIRQGVHFQNVPPVNGREMTAEDVAYSINRYWFDPGSKTAGTPASQKPTSVEALDKWTVQMKFDPGFLDNIFKNSTGQANTVIVAQEMVEEWGDLEDWNASCGTGPFVLVDHVAGSSVTMERNPDYWRMHPLYPEYQMPFPDSVKVLIIGDDSTRLAAFRTGKVYFMDEVGWRESDSIVGAIPEVQRGGVPRYASNWAIFLRNDRQPFDDLNVRLALWKAIDREQLVQFYNGNAWSYVWPVPPLPQYQKFARPLDEAPEILQDAHEYDPERAKELLAEAGYPNGFKFTLDISAAEADAVVPIQAMLAEVDVDMELNVMEHSTYVSIWYGKEFEQAVYGFSYEVPPFIGRYLTDASGNYNFFSDPEVDRLIPEIYKLFMEPDRQAELIQEVAYDHIATEIIRANGLLVGVTIGRMLTCIPGWMRT